MFPYLIGQNQQTLTSDTMSQVQMPFQQNNQFGLNQQQQSWQNNPNNQQFQSKFLYLRYFTVIQYCYRS
jgi:hypothetical protein